MTTIASVIERLEQVKTHSRVADFLIHLAVVGDPYWPAHDMRGRVINPEYRMSDYLRNWQDLIDADDQDFDFPRYTKSIDAAIMLIPAGLYWMAALGKIHETEPLGGCVLFRPGEEAQVAEAEAATVPLSICLAALKAREAA